VGAGGIKAITGQHAPMTMDEILGLLMAKAKLEAEEAQRGCSRFERGSTFSF
jgi:hypothetical protein